MDATSCSLRNATALRCLQQALGVVRCVNDTVDRYEVQQQAPHLFTFAQCCAKAFSSRQSSSNLQLMNHVKACAECYCNYLRSARGRGRTPWFCRRAVDARTQTHVQTTGRGTLMFCAGATAPAGAAVAAGAREVGADVPGAAIRDAHPSLHAQRVVLATGVSQWEARYNDV